MKKTLQIANAVALIITILVNYISNTGIWNGNTMKTVSDSYFNYFTPAGYAFSIWGLIYIGLIGFVIYTGRSLFKNDDDDQIVVKIGWWFVISCIGNSLWVMAWLSLYTGLCIILMVMVLYSLLKIIVNTRMELDAHPFKRYLLIYWPFAIYAGWISVALIANVAAYLTKINWSGWGISEINWTIIMITIAGVVNVFMILTRNLREYGVVGIWALIAIAVSNKSNAVEPVIYASYIVAAIIFVFIGISAFKNRNSSLGSM